MIIKVLLGFLLSPVLFIYFIYMVANEGVCKVFGLYYMVYTGWEKYRKGFSFPDSILALKRLNYMFSKYMLYRLL